MALKEIIDRPFEVKEVRKDGTFEGIASTFGEIDAALDIVMPGAFKNTLAKYDEQKRSVPMLWQHDTHNPIGVYTSVKETDTHLVVTGECNMEVQKGREAHALMKQGALTGLSIGYNTLVDEWMDNGVRLLKELRLWEISPVTFPCLDSARVTSVKSINQLSTLSECEKFLRDAGLTKSGALAFTARFKALLTRSDSAEEQAESISRALDILRSK